MVSHDDVRPPAVDQGLYGLTLDQQNQMPASDALIALLAQAQEDHRKCVRDALNSNENIIDTCALTWGNVWVRYRQWAEYRAPFKTEPALVKWSKAWVKKLQLEKSQETSVEEVEG
ncbi:hypothetical protein XU18_4036 [Perkinsela sp. CCAP 1560/4]|nr:hypothetical protein XU18_4036 [Perkinsela sp. CCAP 1560/4]|eukprot:KNH04797.1 hypothetical protein XU18_4036 [Perkinsela sp. CCAP 1560/4]